MTKGVFCIIIVYNEAGIFAFEAPQSADSVQILKGSKNGILPQIIMFNIGDHIVYGTNGVCRIVEIRNSPFDENDKRLFYVLEPVYDISNSVFYTPVENNNIVIRPLVSAEYARALLAKIREIELVHVEIEKKRRDVYRDLVMTTDPEKFISVIKTVAQRRREFRKTRRRLPDLDNDFEHTSRHCLYGELAEVLGIEREEVHNMVEELIADV